MKTFRTKNSIRPKAYIQVSNCGNCRNRCHQDCTCPDLTVQNQGSPVGTPSGITQINFTGAGVTATATGNSATVTIPGAVTTTSVTLAGDVTGPSGSNTVTALQGIPVSSIPPTSGQVLADVGGVWTPQTLPTSSFGVAEFIHTINSPNNSIPPGTMFTIDTQVINTVPADIIAAAGAGGTVFTLSSGLYELNYEMSLGAAGSVAVYTGPTSGSMIIDPDSVAGSTTATTWIHGRHFVHVATSLVVGISSVVGTAAVVTAGSDASSYMIRLTMLKLS
jgi:hypothetical protein